MPVENYNPLRCGSFGFLSLLSTADQVKKKHGGYRAGAGRKPKDKQPKAEKLCKSCDTAFTGRGNFCEDHKGGICNHEKPIFSNGKQRLACFACDPKPEKKQRKSSVYKSGKNCDCAQCGLAFYKTTYNQKHCSAQCNIDAGNIAAQNRAIANRTDRPCRSCGLIFTPDYGEKNKLSCSQECREKYHSDAKNESVKKKMASDPVYKFARNVRTFLHQSFARTGNKKSERTSKILGCSIDFFRAHIERQFHRGMSWDDRSDWHIDHIRPVSMAKSIDDVISLNHFTNLRPMWASENMSKGAKQTHLI